MNDQIVDRRRRQCLLVLLAQGAFGNTSCGGSSNGTVGSGEDSPDPIPEVAFPLHIEAGTRHIVDATGRPFLIHGDAAWSIAGQLTNAQIEQYLAARYTQGFTAVLFNAPEPYYTSQTPAYDNVDGDAPFIPMTQFASPNEKYWKRVDYLVNRAKARGMACIINPAYLGYASGADGWYDAVKAASAGDLQTYGAWLAKRYTQGNVIWCLGGDQDDSIIVKQWNIVTGMHKVRRSDIITAHALSGPTNADDAYTYWAGMDGFALNTVYGYETHGFFTYALCAQAAQRAMPFLGFEFKYENSQDATLQMLRRQSYGSLLSGACGQIYGNLPIWSFGSPRWSSEPYPGTWQTNLSSAGAVQQGHVKALFSAYAWWKLAPRIDASLVTSGLDSKARRIYPALASDGSFAMIYVPDARTVSVLMSALRPDLVRARFYNPARGTYETVADSPYPNSGTRAFKTVGERVIVLDAAG